MLFYCLFLLRSCCFFPTFSSAQLFLIFFIVVIFIIVAVVITRPPKVEQEIRNGEIVDVNAPEREKTFSEIARESISLSPSFIPFDGNLAKEGSVVGVAEDIAELLFEECPVALRIAHVLAEAVGGNRDA